MVRADCRSAGAGRDTRRIDACRRVVNGLRPSRVILLMGSVTATIAAGWRGPRPRLTTSKGG